MGRWILRIRDGQSIDGIAEKLESVVARLDELGMIIFDASEEDVEKLRKDSRVAYVEKDVERKLSDVPANEYGDDNGVSNLHEVSEISESTRAGEFPGSGQEYYSHLELINKRNFHTNAINDYSPTRTGKGVDCYIVDTGVNFNHPYLRGRVSRVSNFTMNLDGKKDSDNNGHGTYSALFLAGKKCGIAQDVKIYSLKVISDNGSGYNSNILIGINAAVYHHQRKNNGRPSILNYSIGMMPSVGDPTYVQDITGSDYSTLDGLKTATYKGVITISAAGNGFLQGSSLLGPMMSTLTNGQMDLTTAESGNFDLGQGLPIVVGSTQGMSNRYGNNPSKMASFSNYGEGNTIQMAGSSLVMPSRYWSGTSAEKTFVWKSGTSFSCPIVSGLIALHLEKNPTASVTEVRDWLLETGTRGNIDNLMVPISIHGGELELVKGSSVGRIVLPSSLNLGNNWKTIQVVGMNKQGVSKFDDWYDVTSMTSDRILFRLKSSATKNMKVSGSKLTISKVNGTHESTDGIKYWQNKNSSNRIIRERADKSDGYYHIGAVEYTDNLVAFNPYQKYEIDWNGNDKIIFEEGESPSRLMSFIKTLGRNEIPFETKYTVISGRFPYGWMLKSSGKFTKGGNTQLPSANVKIKASNGYAEFTKTFPIKTNASDTSSYHSSITINKPTQGHEYSHDTTSLPLEVSISGSSHAHWHWRLNSSFPSSGSAGGSMVYSNATTITGLTEGTYTVNVALVNHSHNLLQPSVADSVTFTIESEPPPPIVENPDAMQLKYSETALLKLPLAFAASDVTVDWGDGQVQTFSANQISGTTSHAYNPSMAPTVQISGGLWWFGVANGVSYLASNGAYLISVDRWGNLPLTSLENAFYKSANLIAVPDHLPSAVNNIRGMFIHCFSFNDPAVTTWTTNDVEDMSSTFASATSFDQDISSWDLENVDTTANMFANTPFNQDIGGWDMSEVADMHNMFSQPISNNVGAFNQDISSWDVTSVTNFRQMFQNCTTFDQDLSSWCVSHITDDYSSSAFLSGVSWWDDAPRLPKWGEPCDDTPTQTSFDLKLITSKGVLKKNASANVKTFCDDPDNISLEFEDLSFEDSFKTFFIVLPKFMLTSLDIDSPPTSIGLVVRLHESPNKDTAFSVSYVGDSPEGDHMYSFIWNPITQIKTLRLVSECICLQEESTPVCGENGKTYWNECYACCQGIEIAHCGTCAKPTACPE